MTEAADDKATLLLVDDEPGILSSLRRLLRPAGYHILTAESGKMGLEILAQDAVDLVISDMRMPEMDGATFLEQVRLRWPATTRILLTGYADVGSTIDAINRGEIYRYIAKPWDDNDLTLIVRDALERQRLSRENSRLLKLTQAQNEELKDLNSSLEDKVRQRTAEIEQINSFLNLANDKLKQNFLVSIKVFSGLMELRGGAMSGHSRRVAELARKLAIKLGLPGRDLQDIFCAGLLHDIGKIGFSDALLSRPVSRMNGEELGQYRKHVIAGESALMPFDELQDVAKIVRSHHERYDGQGFPDSLEGAAIPLGARILSLVNDYDGLQIGVLSEKKLNADEARTLLLQARGKRYDPQVVDAFIALLDSMGHEIVNEKLVSYPDLKVGMVLARDLLSREGVLLLSVDFTLDVALIKQIHDYAHRENHAVAIYIRTDKH
jgi:putative nucleotidyltransferase with HDIG domain